MTLRILIADDHPVVRAGLVALLAGETDLTVVAEAADGAEAVARYAEHRPDVVLIDLRMPTMGGVEAIIAIRAQDPEARIVAFTTFDGDADIHRALQAGARGYLLKDSLGREVVEALRAVAQDRRVIPGVVAQRLAQFTPRADLTAREVEVLTLVAKGLKNRAVAEAIGRTEDTVKVHLKNIMDKLGAADRTQAVTLAVRRGIITLED